MLAFGHLGKGLVHSCGHACILQHTHTHTHIYDRFRVEIHVEAGGFLDVINLDTPAITTRHYYSGTPNIGVVTFILDFQPPVHCSLLRSPSCLAEEEQPLLALSGELVSLANVSSRWSGWTDQPSGVSGYVLSVYRLEKSQGEQLETMLFMSYTYNETGDESYNELTELGTEGPYSFLLQTLDDAENSRYSRRLVLFDNSSTLNIEPSAPLRVISAVPEAMYLWQNSTSDTIVVGGPGHFYNSHLRANDWLAPVGNRFNVSQDYDHPLAEGRFSREGTPNALGVVRLDYDFTVNQMGSATPPDTFRFSSDDLALEAVSVTPAGLLDGDDVRVWLLAYDYNSAQVNDSVLVYVDSSNPTLQDLSLVWNGVSGLALHGSDRLTDLVIEFDVFDEHSGVFSIQWSIGTGTADVGSGGVAVERVAVEACTAPQCVCGSAGECSLVHHSFSPSLSDLHGLSHATHDAEYYVTVAAINHARLSTQLSLVFTVDATPPLPGVVFDGPPQEADVDYEGRSLALQGWWAGFFDRESDIIVYQYLFAEDCANRSAFAYPLPTGSATMETSREEATMVAPGESVLTDRGWADRRTD